MTAQIDSSVSAENARRKLLFLDDHHLVLDALSFMASPYFDVLTADSVKSFEEAIDKHSPDLAVLDIRVPDGDVFDVARRALVGRPDMKVMFLSMHTESRFIKRAVDIGAKAYLSKRAPMDELLTAINTVLNGGKYMGSRLHSDFEEAHAAPEGALTGRQIEVLRLIAQGCSAKDIAGRLSISVRTAEFHRAAIMDRLKLHSTAMMTRYAVERGLA
ncbi:MAG TPA: response regulator transcription factor [Bryobacteraceae bacterium]|nr:response regulator transcription factor [Bryobacteraceae bacterium]